MTLSKTVLISATVGAIAGVGLANLSDGINPALAATAGDFSLVNAPRGRTSDPIRGVWILNSLNGQIVFCKVGNYRANPLPNIECGAAKKSHL